MNTIGKILVILTLLMALATGGFLVVDFATRKNWREEYEKLRRELVVRDANYKTYQETATKLNTDYRKASADLDIERTKIIEKDTIHKSEIANHQAQLEEEKLRTKEAELNNQRSLAEIDRLKEEVKGLLTTLQKREKIIVTLEEDAKRFRSEAISKGSDAGIMQDRNQNLLEQIRRLQQIIAERETRGSGETAIVRDPNQPNPPTTFVKGIIEKIDGKDRTLVQLSVGTDHGVNKNHTLEVYRTTPRAEYLGTVRIIDSFPHKSVGKLMRSSLPRSPLQEGDIAASTLSNP